MGRIKRLTAAVISAVMLIVCAVPACAELISGTYRSLLSRSLTAADGTFFYTDDYFSHPGSDSDPHLRTASLQLALTAFGAVNETNNHKYTDELLTAAGFTDISAEDMDISPTPDTVGSVIAHKSTEYGEIVAAAVRGGYYGAEWANSLDVGYSGSASGLSAAAKKLVMRIVSYERTHGITGAKIWITGYSRGGGISDLAGRYINEQLSELRMTADDLYVYTFEATAAGDAPTGYKNIHNVRNTNDIMAMLYPASWGLYCSGTDEPLSGSDEHVRRKYFSLTADGYIAEDGSTVSVAVLARETIDWAKQLVPRETFARYSPSITAATVIFASRNSEDAKRVADWFSDIARSVLKSHYVALGTLTAMPENTNMYRKALNRITSDLCDRLGTADRAGIISEDEVQSLRNAVPDIAELTARLLKADLPDAGVHLCSFLCNLDVLLSQHRQETVLPLVMQLDSYHFPDAFAPDTVDIDPSTAKIVKVTQDGTNLKEGSDYTVTFLGEDREQVTPEVRGWYTAVLNGIGSYSGKYEKRFFAELPHYHEWEITSEGNAVKVKCSSPYCDYETGKEYAVRLTGDKNRLYDGTPAKVEITADEGFPAEITLSDVKMTALRGKTDDLTEPDTYTAVLTVSDGEKSATSRFVTWILAIPLSEENTVIELAENSADVLSVRYNGEELSDGDYTVTYIDERGETVKEKPAYDGKYTVKLEGIGHYTGSVSREFTISHLWEYAAAAGATVGVVTAAILVLYRIRRKR